MRYYTAVVLTLSLVAFGGSRTTGATQQATTAAIAPLHAGAFRVDITPPPGPSTFGHGPDALGAQGYWSRLYCRVFLFVTAPEDRVALVVCDLHSISTILHRSVAERLFDTYPRIALTGEYIDCEDPDDVVEKKSWFSFLKKS